MITEGISLKDRADRIRGLRQDRAAKLVCLQRALTRALKADEPFGFPNGSLVLEVIQIEAKLGELES